MILSLLSCIVDQPEIHTLLRRYCDGHYVMFRCLGWVRLQGLASKVPQMRDCSSFDGWCCLLDRKLLLEYALISRRQLGQYCPALESSSSGGMKGFYHMVDVALVNMYRCLYRYHTNAHGRVIRPLRRTNDFGLCWSYDQKSCSTTKSSVGASPFCSFCFISLRPCALSISSFGCCFCYFSLDGASSWSL